MYQFLFWISSIAIVCLQYLHFCIKKMVLVKHGISGLLPVIFVAEKEYFAQWHTIY